MAPLDSSPVFSPEAADFSFLRPLKPTLLFLAFWRFAAERQRVFWQRVQGLPPPWTCDPVLATYKFTNAYRASDRVSQYLIRSVIYEGIAGATGDCSFARCCSSCSTVSRLGNCSSARRGRCIRRASAWSDMTACWRRHSREAKSIYSGAYIMPSGAARVRPFARKHRDAPWSLLAQMLRDELPERIA